MVDESGKRGHEVTREELYALVWDVPLAEVARSFAITDVQLAAVCRRLNVPIPSRDHWTTLAAGGKPKVWPLPRTAKHASASLGQRPARPTPPSAVGRPRESTTSPTPVPAVATAKNSGPLHPLTRKTRAYFLDVKRRVERHAKRRPDAAYSPDDWPPHPDHGRYWCSGEDGYHLCVSLPEVNRALEILDVLTKALTKQGFRISIKQPEHRNRHDRGESRLVAEKKGEELHYRMWESYSQRRYTAKEQAEAERARQYIGKVEYIPNGLFALELSGTEYRIQQTFRETNTKTLDQDLSNIVTAFVDAVPRQIALREERLEEERARQEEAHRRWQEENRTRQEKQLVENLLHEASRARRFAELRGYLDAIEREAVTTGGLSDVGRKWLEEARRLIDLYDPMQARLGLSNANNPDNDNA